MIGCTMDLLQSIRVLLETWMSTRHRDDVTIQAHIADLIQLCNDAISSCSGYRLNIARYSKLLFIVTDILSRVKYIFEQLDRIVSLFQLHHT